MDESRTYYFCLKKVNNISVNTKEVYKQSNGRESYILLLFKKKEIM